MFIETEISAHVSLLQCLELHIIQGRRTFPFFRSHFFSWVLFLFAFTGVQYSDSGYRLGLGKWRLTKKGKQHSSLVFGCIFLSVFLSCCLSHFLSLSLSPSFFFTSFSFSCLLTFACLLALLHIPYGLASF